MSLQITLRVEANYEFFLLGTGWKVDRLSSAGLTCVLLPNSNARAAGEISGLGCGRECRAHK